MTATSPLAVTAVPPELGTAPVLVLGASGFIGGWVARTLAAAGVSTHVVSRSPVTADHWGDVSASPDVIVADLEQPQSVADVLRDVQPAVVFNLAGYGVDRAERDLDRMTTLNVDLVSALCDWADDHRGAWHGLRLVHVGSALEYGRATGQLTEVVAPRPTTDYGRTKLAGTERVIASAGQGSPVAVARLFMVYGPGEHPQRLLPSLVRLARGGGDLDLSAGTQRRDFTYVEDVVEGLLRLARVTEPVGLVNLATGVLTPVREFAMAAAGMLGIDAERLHFGALPSRTEEMNHEEVQLDRLREVTGWSPGTGVADGLRRTLEYEHVR